MKLYCLLLLLFMVRSFGAPVTFEWDREETSSYYILTGTTNGVSWSVTTTNLTHTVTDLVIGVKYTFQVFGVNEFGTGPGSNTLEIIPSDPVEIIPQIDAPTNIEFAGILITQSPQWSLQLKWPKVINAVNYIGEVRVTNSVVFNTQLTDSKIQIPKLRFNETNYVYIKAVDVMGGESPWSDPYAVFIKRDFDSEANLTLHAILNQSK